MRLTAIFTFVTLLASASSFGQVTPVVQYPYGLDPYKPTNAELLRMYGSVLVAQTPLLELAKLDPYKPSHAALLRDLGGAIPLWALSFPPGPLPASLSPFPGTTPSASTPGANILVSPIGQQPATTNATPAPSPRPLPRGVATLRRPESNDGVWIDYAGQRWISAGPAILFDPSAFVRAGQYGSFPVFTRKGPDEDVIYVATRQDLVAPYRLKR